MGSLGGLADGQVSDGAAGEVSRGVVSAGSSGGSAGGVSVPAVSPRLRLSFSVEPSSRFQAHEGSVRESTVVQVGGRWIAYADVVPWDSPYHPNTYATSIYEFEIEADGTWLPHGEVVWPGGADSWDHGGTATPGAVCWKGRILLFYSGRQNPDGSGHRYIGMAQGVSPRGPFVKLPDPVVAGSGHRDDPRPVISPDGERILLYYRLSDGGRYAIRLASAGDPDGPWHDEGEVVPAVGHIRAVETTDAQCVGNRIVLAVMEHDRRPGRGVRTAFYVSEDGRTFARTEPPLFEDVAQELAGGGIASHLTLHVSTEGEVSALGMTRIVGPDGRYTRFVYPVNEFSVE